MSPNPLNLPLGILKLVPELATRPPQKRRWLGLWRRPALAAVAPRPPLYAGQIWVLRLSKGNAWRIGQIVETPTTYAGGNMKVRVGGVRPMLPVGKDDPDALLGWLLFDPLVPSHAPWVHPEVRRG